MTEGPTDNTSSEDLIRQAREAYVPPAETTSPAESVAPAAVPPAAGATASPAAPSTPETAPTPSQPPSPYPEAGDHSHPSDYISADYAETAQPTGPTTYQPHQPSFFSRYGRFLIFGVIVLGIILYNVFDRTKAVDDLAVGDCLRMPDSEEITDVESTDCASEHELEVFALITIPAGVTAPYPGEFAVGEEVFELCLPRFESYVGMDFQSSIWYINAIYPTRESWEDFDDRAGTCVVYQPGLGDDPLTLTGSARNSGQ